MRALLGGVRAAEVAEARAVAALEVQRKLLGAVAGLPHPSTKSRLLSLSSSGGRRWTLFSSMNLRERLSTSACDETRDAPAADDALRRDERRPGVDDGRAAPGAAERERHRAVGRQEAAAVLVEGVGHLHLAPGELVVEEARALLHDEDPVARPREGPEPLGDGAAAGAGPDDDDVVAFSIIASRLLRASQPRGSAP